MNLASAEYLRAAVMEMSFANQALCVEYLVRNAAPLEEKAYAVPEEFGDSGYF